MVFFFDCDDTLLDNDRFRADLDTHLEREFGADEKARYWAHYEELRGSLGYADYLGAIQRLRLERPADPRMATLSAFLLDYPFADRLYPGALDVIAHCGRWGTVAILSDGDAVFQPRKLQRSGLWRAVEGRVLIYIHKEQMLDDVMKRYPSPRYAMVDDKPTILTAMKASLGRRLMTIWPRQGHYADEAVRRGDLPAADLTVAHIGDLLESDFSSMFPEHP